MVGRDKKKTKKSYLKYIMNNFLRFHEVSELLLRFVQESFSSAYSHNTYPPTGARLSGISGARLHRVPT